MSSAPKIWGNFYVDFTRSITRIFLPLYTIVSTIFLALGVPQTLNGYTTVKTIEGAAQTIFVGPVASLDSILQLGTNGGGFYGANAAHPFMNPSPTTNILMISLMLLLPTALIFVFGEMIGKKRESRPLLWGAYILFGLNLVLAFIPAIPLVAPGIETRFGGFMSNFFTVTTTVATTGSVNSALSGMHPLAITSAFLGMFIQSIPGGKDIGMMYMVMRARHARMFKISSKLLAMISAHPRKSDKLFGNYDLRGFRSSFIKQRKRTALKLGNPRITQITFHTFRHWKATMEYHKTKDILHVMRLLGHKNIKNTLIYTQLVTFEDDEYICKTAENVKEAKELIEAGYQYICDMDSLKLFRKRK